MIRDPAHTQAYPVETESSAFFKAATVLLGLAVATCRVRRRASYGVMYPSHSML
jgi:hypothetical protein